jgi:hypothetical protein
MAHASEPVTVVLSSGLVVVSALLDGLILVVDARKGFVALLALEVLDRALPLEFENSVFSSLKEPSYERLQTYNFL